MVELHVDAGLAVDEGSRIEAFAHCCRGLKKSMGGGCAFDAKDTGYMCAGKGSAQDSAPLAMAAQADTVAEIWVWIEACTQVLEDGERIAEPGSQRRRSNHDPLAVAAEEVEEVPDAAAVVVVVVAAAAAGAVPMTAAGIDRPTKARCTTDRS